MFDKCRGIQVRTADDANCVLTQYVRVLGDLEELDEGGQLDRAILVGTLIGDFRSGLVEAASKTPLGYVKVRIISSQRTPDSSRSLSDSLQYSSDNSYGHSERSSAISEGGRSIRVFSGLVGNEAPNTPRGSTVVDQPLDSDADDDILSQSFLSDDELPIPRFTSLKDAEQQVMIARGYANMAEERLLRESGLHRETRRRFEAAIKRHSAEMQRYRQMTDSLKVQLDIFEADRKSALFRGSILSMHKTECVEIESPVDHHCIGDETKSDHSQDLDGTFIQLTSQLPEPARAELVGAIRGVDAQSATLVDKSTEPALLTSSSEDEQWIEAVEEAELLIHVEEMQEIVAEGDRVRTGSVRSDTDTTAQTDNKLKLTRRQRGKLRYMARKARRRAAVYVMMSCYATNA